MSKVSKNEGESRHRKASKNEGEPRQRNTSRNECESISSNGIHEMDRVVNKNIATHTSDEVDLSDLFSIEDENGKVVVTPTTLINILKDKKNLKIVHVGLYIYYSTQAVRIV